MSLDHDPGKQHDLNLLAALVEGRVAPEERRGGEQHLTTCESCRATLATWSGALPGSARRPTTALPVWLGAAAAVVLAAWLGNRVASTRPGPISETPKTGAPGAAAPILRPTQAAPSSAGPAAGSAEQELQTKRGGEKRIGDKTFRLVAGEWIDSNFDSTGGLPVVEVSGAAERRALLRKEPTLAPYARLGERVTVVVGGTVYRFLPSAL